VLDTGNGTLIPVEAKASYLSKPVIPAGLRSFLRSYTSPDAYIVNLSLEIDVTESNTTFHFILPWQLSLINRGR
jgi:hypothetical protein